MAATDKRERRGHFRGKPRPGRRVEVLVQAGDRRPERAWTRNIGVGGAFIVTSVPERPGTPLVLTLRVPTTPHELQVRAEVRWVTGGGDAAEPPGMGVKFHGLDVEQLLALNDYFASLAGGEEPVGPS